MKNMVYNAGLFNFLMYNTYRKLSQVTFSQYQHILSVAEPT